MVLGGQPTAPYITAPLLLASCGCLALFDFDSTPHKKWHHLFWLVHAPPFSPSNFILFSFNTSIFHFKLLGCAVYHILFWHHDPKGLPHHFFLLVYIEVQKFISFKVGIQMSSNNYGMYIFLFIFLVLLNWGPLPKLRAV